MKRLFYNVYLTKTMKKQAEQVSEFHNSFKIPMPGKLSIPTHDNFAMRQRILQEEIDELKEAGEVEDIVAVADAIVDCMYILIGTAEVFGFSELLEDLFSEVHRSNMSKLDNNGQPIYREDGKVLKGANYSEPKLAKILFR